MKPIEHVLQEFIDAIYAADNESDFERVATRVTQRLGFRWFAYLRITDNAPALISSYPKSWTSRYFASRYQQLDPVVRRARLEYDSFSWSGGASKSVGTREQRKFFDEAVTFGIKSGITVPIRGGFGRIAAFTLATSESAVLSEQLIAESRNVIHLITPNQSAPIALLNEIKIDGHRLRHGAESAARKAGVELAGYSISAGSLAWSHSTKSSTSVKACGHDQEHRACYVDTDLGRGWAGKFP
jgi:Autoinducer binding domain